MAIKKIEDNLSEKELELANLVDFFNDCFLDRRAGKRRAKQFEKIIINLVQALNKESDHLYKAETTTRMCLLKNGQAISDREYHDALNAKANGQPYVKALLEP